MASPSKILAEQDGQVVLEVRNVAPPIPAELLPMLYSPLKHASVGNVRNRGGWAWLAHRPGNRAAARRPDRLPV
jgi:hypothetical protein